MSTVPLKQRWFEDYAVGEVLCFGDRLVTTGEIVESAGHYDPQPFPVDAAAAAQSHSGGLLDGKVMVRCRDHS